MNDDIILRQRFSIVCEMDVGVDYSVTAASDGAFDNHLVCILELPRQKWIDDWLKKRLPQRCLLFHPHVLKIYDIFISGDEIRLIFEHPKGNNLLEFLKKFKASEDFVRNLFQQLVFAIDHYHNQAIYGLDVSLERLSYNFECGILKIIDFGFSDWNTADEQTHSLPYIAPEQIRSGALESRQAKGAVDVWRCGVLLYCMLFRAFPFCPDTKAKAQEQIFNILRGMWKVPEEEQVSEECLNLLQRMLDINPGRRIELQEIKKHPWYRTKLPDGVLEYEAFTRPDDGLLKKVEAVRSFLTSD